MAMLYLLSVIGLINNASVIYNSCTRHFTQNQNTRIIIFRSYIFLGNQIHAITKWSYQATSAI